MRPQPSSRATRTTGEFAQEVSLGSLRIDLTDTTISKYAAGMDWLNIGC